MMKWQALLCVASSVRQVFAIFADDAFHIDYHDALLGIPQSHTTFFHKPQVSSNASLLYTISDKAVLGAVNPKDGALLWRQALAGQPIENASAAYIVTGDDGKIISAYDQKVAAWDALDGKLLWDYVVEPTAVIRDLQAVPILGGIADGTSQDVVVLSESVDGTSATITRINGDSNVPRWQYTNTGHSQGSSISVATSSKHVYFITKSHGPLSTGKAKVVVLDVTTGAEISHYNINTDSEPLGNAGHYSTGSCSSFPFIASTEAPYKSIKLNILGLSKLSTLKVDDKDEDILGLNLHYACTPEAPSHILVHVRGKNRQWAEVFHVDSNTGDVKKVYSLPATQEVSAFGASSKDSDVYFTRVSESEIVVYSSVSHGQLGRWPRRGDTGLSGGSISHVASEVVVRGMTGLSVRAVETSVRGAWSLIRNGELQWIRPELLAYATAAVWSEDEGPRSLIEELEVAASGNPITAYVHRLTRHIQDLAHLSKYLMKPPQNIFQTIFQSSQDTISSTRAKLVGSKLLLVGTSRHEIVALDAGKAGAIKWHKDVSDLVGPSSQIRVMLAENGRGTAYLSDGGLIVLDVLTGAVIEHQEGTIPLSSIVQLPGQPESALVKVGADGVPKLATDFAPPTATEGNVLVTISETGNAIGWSVGQSVQRMWTLRPRSGAKFTNAVSRPAYDPVASIGKVLGDRSVLYKYVSPNIALLTAMSATTLTVYLIEAVTGTVLHTTTHQGVLVDQPIPAVVSENWFAYSFTSQDVVNSGPLTQLIVSDMYESSTANDRGSLSARTNYSSFDPDVTTQPHVISQAFTIAEPMSQMAVTQTIQGITTRQLLATLPHSQAIIGIPREILNPRRPVDRDPTSTEIEEGLFRYNPVLELDPKLFLTHSREVMGINKLMSSPTLLESTSMVFGFGHDIFGTQVAPSMAFDVLGKQFNKIQLSMTVVALFAGVLAIRPLVTRKTVEGRWRM